MLVLPLAVQDHYRATTFARMGGQGDHYCFRDHVSKASLEKNSKHKLQPPETNSPREHHRSWGTNANLETIELQRPAPETTSHREHHSSRDQYNSKEHLVPGTCSSIETNKVHETISSRRDHKLHKDRRDYETNSPSGYFGFAQAPGAPRDLRIATRKSPETLELQL